MPETQISRFELRGFKSIRQLADFELGELNVLIGANGAGKSNFISFFRLLGWMVQENLQFHVGDMGGGNSLLFDGAEVTPQIEAAISFQTNQGINEYRMRLFHAAGDVLIFADEDFRFSRDEYGGKAAWTSLSAGHRETRLIEAAAEENATARFILRLLKGCVVYQFHNTSKTARIRQKWRKNDNLLLKEDGCNLAPILFRLREANEKYYLRIVRTIRQILPFFGDFAFDEDAPTLQLRWTERETDAVFGADQASDGMLRAMALVTLLLQPIESLPPVIILDEPELGLHPYAISVVAGLLKSVSLHRQVILATQSTAFIDCFDPEDIIVVDREGRESTFSRPDVERLSEWIETYSIAELWEKNVLGGRPA